jgi:hypothetical protein
MRLPWIEVILEEVYFWSALSGQEILRVNRSREQNANQQERP